jgi:acyl-CoA ligase (AMP-forming) (exosortase A-associated)
MIYLFHHLLTESCERYSAKPALLHMEKLLSYGQLQEYTDRVAELLMQSGVSPGDRVAIYLEKSIDESASLIAVSKAGAIFVDINPLLRGRQIGHILNDSGARVLITSRQRLKNVAGDLPRGGGLTTVVITGPPISDEVSVPTPIRVVGLEHGIGDISSRSWRDRRIGADPAGIIYTSGSTGLPKGVVVSHQNLVAGAESVASYLHNTQDDRILSILPFSFDAGLNQLTTSLLVGATLVLQNYLGPNDILDALESRHITGLAGIPTLWSQLIQLKWTGERFPSLRYITNTGGRFPEHLVKEYRQRLPNAQIYLMYGLTEAFRSTYLDPSEIDRRPTSIGKAIPNAEILVLDENRRPCAPGQVGELVHRGVHVALGYWNDRERTRERFHPNPLRPNELKTEELVVFSGDLVKQDEEGYIYYVGRKDQMIKTSGFRVSPTEVEECFYATGKVRDAVALGIPDDQLGEWIKVILALRDGESISPQELLSLAAKEMPAYMVPKEVVIRAALPKNPNGKIDRAAIYREVLHRQVSE